MTTFYYLTYIDETKNKIALAENQKVIVYSNKDNARDKAKELNSTAKIEIIELIEDTEFDLHFTIGD